MRVFAIVILVCLQAALPLGQERSIKDVIDDFVQRLKNLIPDPVEFPEVELELPENDFISGYSKTNGTITGLRNFSVDVQYSGIIIPVPTGFTLTIPNQSFYVGFASALQISNSSVLGYDIDGHYRRVISDLVIAVGLDYTAVPLGIDITSLSYSIGGIQYDIEGVISDKFSAALGTILSNTVANVLNTYEELICAALLEAINSIIGSILGEMYARYPENLPIEVSEENAVDELRRFFGTLESILGIQSSCLS